MDYVQYALILFVKVKAKAALVDKKLKEIKFVLDEARGRAKWDNFISAVSFFI